MPTERSDRRLVVQRGRVRARRRRISLTNRVDVLLGVEVVDRPFTPASSFFGAVAVAFPPSFSTQTLNSKYTISRRRRRIKRLDPVFGRKGGRVSAEFFSLSPVFAISSSSFFFWGGGGTLSIVTKSWVRF